MTAVLFAFRGGEILVAGPDGADLPSVHPEDLGLAPLYRHPLGAVAGRAAVAVRLPPDAAEPPGFRFIRLRALHGLVPDPVFGAAGRAFQLVEWDRTHRFCGACGAPTTADASENARACAACGLLFFPRIAPAVIVLVRRGEEALLARSPHFAPGVYSPVAGFVEPGESLEDAVRREVLEETGVALADVRYFGSQPWPFPHSLMVGFTAEYAGGELRLQPDEIEDAGWFAPDRPPVLPSPISIARALVDSWLDSAASPPRRPPGPAW